SEVGSAEVVMTTKYTWIFMSNPIAGREADFDTYYEQHYRDILEVPGVTSAQRLKAITVTVTGEPEFQHVAMYDVETDDPDALFQELRRRFEGQPAAPGANAMQKKMLSLFCAPISPRLTR